MCTPLKSTTYPRLVTIFRNIKETERDKIYSRYSVARTHVDPISDDIYCPPCIVQD